ncbi:imidazole glycerol phosphate synthase subunit HisH [Nitratidesulfovibrio sp. SRB-5]|uniref:Imidazole glycerol phosphate synthase subunit HisH n=1 Tax=Nitratidesulfovibrio vulgaris (strain DSM 19637 / Miyazaki F) TaxID=883 RepID=HIS5_NITV9|nr:imidazole glycerol phosphate synthase subunit HisH [Nitratidesulfovibrio sp. SRB-5]B8DQX7.1 RecName: Full=Imidazole glycerol phosphate synthase subunit HisH; AltName: Full=IGP synthase glutaminase subunit; AltName: Full=IGP synthase subunit HisH; AltName: Full=ImGP synthase subunit HisH; Short=IGPS subunit HisH [Nitratidesulfovibrio vulgaris str. 'Miyazaki F']MBZ2170470.1 imidazole glycerol phosphate synthase subunit HisH [Nitratidesulfovibrio sp. SRB-5]RXF78235.1 imidazole glycerol phosphate
MLAILDYKAGNQTSVRRALDHLGIPCVITADPAVIAGAHGVIFPGVGAAGQAMNELLTTGLDKVLKDQVQAGKPLLGICVGCQIMLDYSQENDTKALGIVPGECRLFNAAWTEEDGTPIRVPHMGWNSIVQKRPCELLKGIEPEAEFYFVHSYYPAPPESYVIATCTYGEEFCAIHGGPGLWAVQFHPEKSGRPGLALLRNFYAYCKEASRA